jgi:ParB-like chromosome segregation protein Spo0J
MASETWTVDRVLDVTGYTREKAAQLNAPAEIDGETVVAYNEQQWAEFLEDVKANGVKEPLWLDSDGFLEDGCHRLAAAVQLGLESVPVEVID